MPKSDISKKGVLNHHAYIAHGVALSCVVEYVENVFGVQARGNPDWVSEYHDVFSILESRRLRELAYTHAIVEGASRVFILSCNSITSEAQNALLKLLEEPRRNTFFFISVPSLEILFPTLRSRMQVLNLLSTLSEKDRANESDTEFAGQFLKSSPSGRSSMVQKILKEKDKNTARGYVEDLMRAFYEKRKVVGEDSKLEINTALKELQRVYSYLGDRSASLKLLLEHLCVVLPRVG